MSENEIFARGLVAGISIVLPFLGLTVARWRSWKGWSDFWQMMHKDLQAQNTRLFNALKSEELKRKYFECQLKHTINMYKPIKESKEWNENLQD